MKDNNKQEKTVSADGDGNGDDDDDHHHRGPSDPWRDSMSVVTSSTVTTSRYDLLSGCVNGKTNISSSSSPAPAAAAKSHDGIRAKVKWLKDELSDAKTTIRDLQVELDKARAEYKQVREEVIITNTIDEQPSSF